MSLRIVSATDVARITATFDPQELTDLMAQVFHSLSTPEEAGSPARAIHQPHRTSVPVTNHTALFMPSRIEPFGTAIKVVSVPTSTAPHSVKAAGLPGTTLVLGESSGAVRTVVNARQLTALRNAAGSLLATRMLLPPDAQPQKLIAFGAGAQIAAHLSLFCKHYTSITSCTVFNRSVNERLTKLVSKAKEDYQAVQFVARAFPQDTSDASFHRTIEEADLIITATSSTTPFFPSAYVKPGAHLCLIGSYTPQMHEVETDLVKRAGKVVVDSREACLLEAGELIAAQSQPSNLIEVGELVQRVETTYGTAWVARPEVMSEIRNAGDVTIFKSVGVGVQDVAIASAIANRAEQENIGTVVADYDEVP